MDMSTEDLILFRDFFKHYGCITNNKKQMLPYERQAVEKAFKDAVSKPDY